MTDSSTILLVDDHPENLFVLQTQLRGLGAAVVDAENAQQALDVLHAHHVAVAIVDVRLPDMDGFQLAEAMRESVPAIPIVFVTSGQCDQARLFRGYQAGAVDFLVRPIELEVLRSKVAAFLELDRRKRGLVDRVHQLEVARAQLAATADESARQLALIQSIYDSAPVGLCVLDRQLRFLRINRYLAKTNGIPVAEHLGKTVDQLLPSLAEPARAIAEQVFRSGAAVTDIELTGSTPAQPGKQRTWIEHWLPLKDGGGAVTAINVVAEEVTERRAAEQALRESERRYRELFENLAEGFFVADLVRDHDGHPVDYRFVAVNAAFEAIVGLSRAAVVGRTAREVFQAVDDDWLSTFTGVASSGTPARLEKLAPSGRTFSLVAYTSGPDQFACLFQDVSQRKRAEAELRASEARFRTVVDNSSDAIDLLDFASERFVFASPAEVELTGFAPDEIGRLTFAEVAERVHPDERAAFVAHHRDVRAGHERTPPVEYRWQVKPGEYRWLSTNRNLVRDERGTPVALVSVSRDVTERKQSEAKIRRSKELGEALNRIADLVHGSLEIDEVLRRLVDDAARVLGADTAAFSERVAGGWRVACANGLPDAVVGTVMSDDQERHAVLALQAQQPLAVTDVCNDDRVNRAHLLSFAVRAVLVVPVIRAGHAFGVMFFNYHGLPRTFDEAELHFARQLGHTAAIALHNARLFADRARVEAALNRSNAQLREADRSKNDFIASLSHELRNPLAPIRNALHVLDRAQPGSEQDRRARAVIARQADQMTRLVNDLLDVTRITTNKILLERRPLDLNEVLARTAEDHRAELEQAGLCLQVETATVPAWVDADPHRIAQIVGNLLQNAAKFTPVHGRVTVSVAVDEAGRQATIRVADTGIGMERDTLANLFQPFVQAAASLDRSKGGLGLGLALVKGLAGLHGGSVAAESPGIGRGSTFTVRLPLAAAGPAPTAARVAYPPLAPQRILIIEDNVDAAETLRDVLELDRHEVSVVHDGPTGIGRVREFRPTLVLCDIGLPGMDGYAVARALRADPAVYSLALVALTGYVQAEDLQRAQEAGFDRHLGKPIDLDELRELIRDVTCASPPAKPSPASRLSN